LPINREILFTIQGKDLENNEESIEEELVSPSLENLNIIGEEFASSMFSQEKKAKLADKCFKEDVKDLNSNAN
jgi:hypothetical protein